MGMAVKRGCLPWTTQYISVVYDTSKFTNDKSCSLGNATYMDHKKAEKPTTVYGKDMYAYTSL
jgi:hypothetical protein